jgi:general secretion pathway protein K
VKARRPGQEGFALLLVVLLLVLVAGFLLDRAVRARTEYRQAWNAAGEVRARAAARAGVADAMARLAGTLRRRGAAEPITGLATYALRDETLRRALARAELAPGVAYEVRVEDASARLPLNLASEDELRALFLAAGAGFQEADVAAQSVLDWRDPDGLHRARGAEWDDWYRTLPVPVRPRNGPFESVDELRHVRGMERLYPRVVPLLTVLGTGRVNLNTAPPEVLRALPGMDDESVGLVLSRRRGPRPLRDFFEVEGQLSPPSRARLQGALQAFLERAAFDSDLVEVEASGRVEGLPFTRTVRALVARSGPTVQVVRSFEE